MDWNKFNHLWGVSGGDVTFLRRCGLKHSLFDTKTNSKQSPSYEGVDWNFIWFNTLSYFSVSHLLTKVWIETLNSLPGYPRIQQSPSYEGVDWNCKIIILVHVLSHRHLLTKVWIETTPPILHLLHLVHVTFLRRCGLKHSFHSLLPSNAWSPSYEGVDWNFHRHATKYSLSTAVTFLRRCGLKPVVCLHYPLYLLVTFLRRCGLKQSKPSDLVRIFR